MEKKKPWVKPELKRVELKPEDAVLTACKNYMGGPRGACKKGVAVCSQQMGS